MTSFQCHISPPSAPVSNGATVRSRIVGTSCVPASCFSKAVLSFGCISSKDGAAGLQDVECNILLLISRRALEAGARLDIRAVSGAKTLDIIVATCGFDVFRKLHAWVVLACGDCVGLSVDL